MPSPSRNHFKKLWSTILSNGVRQDLDGNWTVINSSTNKRRMEKTGSSVGGSSGPQQQEWIPSKILITPQDLEDIWLSQEGRCYWFGVPLDLGLLYKTHPDWMPKHPLAPSIDKIDPSGDYTKENIVICTRFANFGRNVCDFNRFHDIVKYLKEGSDAQVALQPFLVFEETDAEIHIQMPQLSDNPDNRNRAGRYGPQGASVHMWQNENGMDSNGRV